MKARNDVKHVFIVGSKGIPAHYGGFETFVDKLTEYHQNEPELKYHVACRSLENNDSFEYHNADCFRVKVPKLGSAQAIYYDIAALFRVCKYIKQHKIPDSIVYILACRIGIFAPYFQKKIHRLGGKLYLNPDGHEWKRSKWPLPVRMYWKISESIMVRSADMIVCDNQHIEQYIQNTYHKSAKQTTYIPYGAEIDSVISEETERKLNAWLQEKGISANGYYLSVGRLVPENNYETMIREYMRTGTDKSYVIITTLDTKYLDLFEKTTRYSVDPRIKFVGPVYDQELLNGIRQNAFAYLHGHEVGGTNPSLLEAMATTGAVLLNDVSFNREVAKDTAFYWTKQDGALSQLIDSLETDKAKPLLLQKQVEAKQRIAQDFSWRSISERYRSTWMDR